MEAIIRTTPIEVTGELTDLGLSVEILREAMLVGESARDTCTANDPPNAAGFDAWARTVRALREMLIPQGWTRNDDANFSTVISPDGRVAIAVATGDEGTGNPGATPKTKYPKGPATVAAIRNNRRQLLLFKSNEITTGDDVATWMLVRRRVEDSLFSELSLPADLGEDERVVDWAVRIILEPISLEPTPIEDRTDQIEQIEIEVRRRS